MRMAKSLLTYVKEEASALDYNPKMRVKRLLEHVIGALVHLLTHRKLTTPEVSFQRFMHNDILTFHELIEDLEYLRTHHFQVHWSTLLKAEIQQPLMIAHYTKASYEYMGIDLELVPPDA